MKQGSVVIAGAGIGGLTAALCLARHGLRAVVLEQDSRIEASGAGIQLGPNATRVLRHLGLGGRLAASGVAPERAVFRSSVDGRVLAQWPLGESVTRAYGHPYWHVHREDLIAALRDAADASPLVEVDTGVRVTGVAAADGGVRVGCEGGFRRGEVLVGADGIHSTVRRLLFGADTARFSGQVAWRALVPAERLAPLVAPPEVAVWWGRGRHFVHYRVRGGALVNCVGVVEKSGWEVESWTERGDVAELRRDFAGWDARVQALIDAVDPSSLYRWALHDRAPMPRWGEGAVTLLGDACHPMLPFLAQGAAMAIEDAAVLGSCLAGDSEPARGLRRYESLRRARTARIQRQSARNGRIYHLGGIAAWLRDRAAGIAGGRTMRGLFGYDALGAA